MADSLFFVFVEESTMDIRQKARIAKFIFKQMPCEALCDDFITHISNIAYDTQRVSNLSFQRHFCFQHNFAFVTNHINQRIESVLSVIAAEIDSIRQIINPPATITFRDILAELNAIEADFGELKFDFREKYLVIMTDAITLEDVDLGAFDIYLPILADGRHYVKAIARDPNPAANDSKVTHPHVSSNIICLGDGKTAVWNSIRDGRFSDAFQLCVNILNTYNPSSPYIKLEEWDGGDDTVSCQNCDEECNEEEIYHCYMCDKYVCDSCYSGRCSHHNCHTSMCVSCEEKCYRCETGFCSEHDDLIKCNKCEESFCKDCISSCNICDEWYCHRCQALGECKECNKSFCKDCANEDDSEMCENCSVETEEEEISDEVKV